MILGFSKKEFKPKILALIKIHSLREDKNNRWKVGRIIHMALGVRTKKYECFKRDRCTGIERVYIDAKKRKVYFLYRGKKIWEFNETDMYVLSQNDGFDTVADFWLWFGKKSARYKIIHWTEKRYGLPF